MAAIICLTSLIHFDSYDGAKSYSQNYGVFDYYFKTMWTDLSNLTTGITDKGVLFSNYFPAILSVVAVIANIAITITVAVIGCIKSVQNLINRKGVSTQLFVLIALISNVAMGAVLMMNTSYVSHIETTDTAVSAIYFNYSLSTALNISIALLTIALVLYMAFRIYKAFDKSQIKPFISKILLAVGILLTISVISSVGSSIFSVINYTTSSTGVTEVTTGGFSIFDKMILLYGGGQEGVANLIVVNWVLFIIGVALMAVSIAAMIVMFKKFISDEKSNPLVWGILIASFALIYFAGDVTFALMHTSIFGNLDVEGTVYFVGDGAISTFIYSLVVFALFLVSSILAKTNGKKEDVAANTTDATNENSPSVSQ